MNYGNSSTSLNNELTGFRTDILNMNNISFDGWTGSAKDSYLSIYKSNMSNLEIEFEKIGVFSELLAQVEVYKQRKEEIARLQSQLSSLPNTQEYSAQRSSLAAAISQLQAENEQLKAIIKGTKVIVAGLVGKVVGILDEEKVVVEFADGVQIQVMRAYISQVIFDTPNSKK